VGVISVAYTITRVLLSYTASVQGIPKRNPAMNEAA
jgi:hypothetical protein